MALALGPRQGEALGLLWDAVDLDTGILRVRRPLRLQAGRGLVLVEPESRAGRRTIKRPTHSVLLSGSMGFDRQSNGCPQRTSGRTAGVRDARLHDARHTAATLLLQQGVPARVVTDILGHSQIGLTPGTFSHGVPERAQEAADRMGNALWG